MDHDPKPGFWTEGFGATMLAWGLVIGGLMVWAFTADWMDANGYEVTWGAVAGWYFVAGLVIGGLGAVALFFGAWWFAAENYGAAGFLFGWLPGGVLAFVGGWLMVFLWGLAALVGCGYLLLRR